MKLYFSRNPNPRLAVTVARYLETKVDFEFASPFAAGQIPISHCPFLWMMRERASGRQTL